MKTFRVSVKVLLLIGCFLAVTASALAGKPVKTRSTAQIEAVRFGVIADPHLYNARLGTSGTAWQLNLYRDPKLLKESEAILASALESIAQQGVQFIILPGDLTKDGELVDHVLMAQHLAKLAEHRIQAFVVPGNHDINNPYAVTYVGDTTRVVPNVSPEVFRALYQRFGYGQALVRDSASLSYVAEPVPGLWLLAIDSCKYQDNEALGTPVVSGQIKPETMSWILCQLQEAQTRGKQVIAFMHHGVNLHFFGEDVLFPDYLVDDWPEVSAQLAAAGLKVVFTGHYHSQDAAYPVDATGQPVLTLCDVETGSLVQYPCAFRIVTVAGDLLQIESHPVTEANVYTGGLSFQDYAKQNLSALMQVQIDEELAGLFGLTPDEIAQVAPLVTDALIANYAGDEAPSPEIQTMIDNLMNGPYPYPVLGGLLEGLWTDLWPPDNNLVVPFAFSDNSVGRPGPVVPVPPSGGPGAPPPTP